MYKVFINDSSITLVSKHEILPTKMGLIGNVKALLKQAEKMEMNEQAEAVTWLCDDLEGDWAGFCDQYTLVEAAGGVVQNQANELLLIYRLGKWDLPKGKIEVGENRAEAALREVEEECGLLDINLGAVLPTTYHTYVLRGQRILKPTYWYKMTTTYKGKLVPQTEEDISAVRWVPIAEAQSLMKESYASIAELMRVYWAGE